MRLYTAEPITVSDRLQRRLVFARQLLLRAVLLDLTHECALVGVRPHAASVQATAFELVDGGPQQSFNIQGSVYHLVKLR